MTTRNEEAMMDYADFLSAAEHPQAAPQPPVVPENASGQVAVGPEGMEGIRANGEASESEAPKPQPSESTASSPQEKAKETKPVHDFRKCELSSLQKYIEHHGLTAKPDASIAELAALVGRHFEKEQVDEEIIIHNFLSTGAYATNSLFKLDKKRKRTGGNGGPGYRESGYSSGSNYIPRKEMRLSYGQIAKVDEEVAVRPNHQVSDDAAAGWILARVIKYLPERDQYHVRDEDDHSNVMTVPSSNVIRLMDDNVNDVKKDDTVLAVFPDTTSFYRAIVTKLPKRVGPGPQEVHCKFEDDEDETGRTPHRRVPARYVLRLGQVGGRYDNGGDYSDGDRSRDGNTGASRKAMRDYKAMISHALKKLPNNKGTLKDILKIIENDFNDELVWKLEGEGKKTPAWKLQVRKILINPRSGFMFINSGERAYYSQAGGGGGGYGEH